MSQNRTGNETDFGGGAGTGATSAGTTRDNATTGGGDFSGGGGSMTTGGGGGAAAGTATAPASGITGKAKEYGQTVANAATQARDYISDKASAVGDKLQNLDYQQYADQAKDYARQNPGQALLVAAAAGFVIGLLVRGGRR
jgi:ElaB/YqjD/DUF883 family membrane-anchored ribosome-binding protein